MYNMMSAFNPMVFIFFVFAFFITCIFGSNLIIAVLKTKYAKKIEDYEEDQAVAREQEIYGIKAEEVNKNIQIIISISILKEVGLYSCI